MLARRVKGFTLIETLIAVSILGTVAATIFLGFSTGMEAQSRVEGISENLNRARFALDLVADDLRSPGRISPGILEGWDDGFRLALGTTTWNEEWIFSETEWGAETVEYRLLDEPVSGRVLVRRLLRGEEVLSEVELLGRVSSFEIMYFMSEHGGMGTWVDEWDPAEGLPFAVKIVMSVPAEDEPSTVANDGSSTDSGGSASDDKYSVSNSKPVIEYRRLVSLPPSWLRPPLQGDRLGTEEG
jgi:prepilin-type N-terminal cleavage/methylation domain-containing protein